MSEIFTDKPGDHAFLYEFLAAKTGLPWSTDLRVIGTMRGVAPTAVVGYNAWVGKGVFMHVAFENPHALSRDLLREAFIYPFITCRMQVVYAMTLITNEEAIRLIAKLGFREKYRDENFVMFKMTFDEWVDAWEASPVLRRHLTIREQQKSNPRVH